MVEKRKEIGKGRVHENEELELIVNLALEREKEIKLVLQKGVERR